MHDATTLHTHDGLDIVVHISGEGPPVVLLHGATLDAASNWLQPGIAAAIENAGYRVLMPDLRGHGHSTKPTEANAMRLDDWVADVRLVLDAFDITRTALVGYSLGSVIALQAAARDARIAAVLAGGLALDIVDPEPMTPEREEYVRQLAADDDADVTDERARQTRAWDRSQGVDPKVRAALIRALRQPRRVDFDAVTVPVLIVNGDEDLPPDTLVARLPNARSARVKGDHAVALSDPNLARRIVAFLDHTLRA